MMHATHPRVRLKAKTFPSACTDLFAALLPFAPFSPSSSPQFLCCCAISSPLLVLLTLHLLPLLIPASLFVLSLFLARPLITALITGVRLSSRTAPVMVCSTTPPWAEMLLVPHQSTSCPARCLRMCTVESHNRSAREGLFSSPLAVFPLWCSAETLSSKAKVESKNFSAAQLLMFW